MRARSINSSWGVVDEPLLADEMGSVAWKMEGLAGLLTAAAAGGAAVALERDVARFSMTLD